MNDCKEELVLHSNSYWISHLLLWIPDKNVFSSINANIFIKRFFPKKPEPTKIFCQFS